MCPGLNLITVISAKFETHKKTPTITTKNGRLGHSEIPVLCTEMGQSSSTEWNKALGDSRHIVTVPSTVLIPVEGK